MKTNDLSSHGNEQQLKSQFANSDLNIHHPTDKREIEVNTDLTSKTYLNEPGYPLCNEDIHIKTKILKSQSKNGGNSVETQTNLQKTTSPRSPGFKMGVTSKIVSQK